MWAYKELVELGYKWIEIFTDAFNLNILKDDVVLEFARLSKIKAIGTFLCGYSPRGELNALISFNTKYFDRIEDAKTQQWFFLAVLLHELLHKWQVEYGKPPKRGHNKEFINKSFEVGLETNKKGCILGIVKGHKLEQMFIEHLDIKDGFNIPDFSDPPKEKKKSQKDLRIEELEKENEELKEAVKELDQIVRESIKNEKLEDISSLLCDTTNLNKESIESDMNIENKKPAFMVQNSIDNISYTINLLKKNKIGMSYQALYKKAPHDLSYKKDINVLITRKVIEMHNNKYSLTPRYINMEKLGSICDCCKMIKNSDKCKMCGGVNVHL